MESMEPTTTPSDIFEQLDCLGFPDIDIRNIPPYAPGKDYWRLLRLQISAFHQFQTGPMGLHTLDTAIELAHPDCKNDYRNAVTAYRSVIRDHTIKWVGKPRRGIVVAGEKRIRVAPSMILNVDGVDYVVQLTLTDQPLEPPLAGVMVHLIASTHGHLGRPIVLDVLAGKSYGRTTMEMTSSQYDQWLATVTS